MPRLRLKGLYATSDHGPSSGAIREIDPQLIPTRGGFDGIKNDSGAQANKMSVISHGGNELLG